MELSKDSKNRPHLVFIAPIKITGVNPYVLVSTARAKKLKPGWRKPMPVLLRINGAKKTWRTNMMPNANDTFNLYLHGEMRKASETKVGDKVEVEIAFDEKYKSGPMHPMPKWFRSALSENPKAKTAWSALSPSRKKEILRYFANLKSPEAQERNLKRAMSALSGKEERFMGRGWKGGK
jgi:hypothetical protein